MKKLYSFLSIGLLSLSAIGQSTQDVTFKVDMNNYSGAAFTSVYVNGTFNGWAGSTNPLTDANKDGVWEGTVNIKADSIEYKFNASLLIKFYINKHIELPINVSRKETWSGWNRRRCWWTLFSCQRSVGHSIKIIWW